MLRDFLNRDGVEVGRRLPGAPRKRRRIEALHRKPNTAKPAPGNKIYPCLLRGLKVERPNRVRACRSRWKPSSASRRWRRRWPDMRSLTFQRDATHCATTPTRAVSSPAKLSSAYRSPTKSPSAGMAKALRPRQSLRRTHLEIGQIRAGQPSRLRQRRRCRFCAYARRVVRRPFPQRRKKNARVQDNRSANATASLNKTFAAAEDRRLVERFEWRYTPRRGSRLDIAESELAVLSTRCLDRRIANKPELIGEVAAWEQNRNKHHAKADGQFTTASPPATSRHSDSLPCNPPTRRRALASCKGGLVLGYFF